MRFIVALIATLLMFAAFACAQKPTPAASASAPEAPPQVERVSREDLLELQNAELRLKLVQQAIAQKYRLGPNEGMQADGVIVRAPKSPAPPAK